MLIINSAKLGIVTDDVKPQGNGKITIESLVQAGLLDVVPADPSVDGQTYSAKASYVTYKKTGNKETYTITLAPSKGTKYYSEKSEAELNGGAVSTP